MRVSLRQIHHRALWQRPPFSHPTSAALRQFSLNLSDSQRIIGGRLQHERQHERGAAI